MLQQCPFHLLLIALWVSNVDKCDNFTMLSLWDIFNLLLPSFHFFVLFEKSNFLREYYLLSYLPFKNV